jgi:CubicO group peptidase (beta-lactamase class C family)
MDAYLKATFPADAPGAVVLVVRDGKTLLRAAYGLADVERKTRLTPASVFHLASVTKTLTAAAILQRVERGQLSLDDDITKYVPDAPTHGRRITLRQLLSHTSGLFDFAEVDVGERRGGFTPAQIVDLVREKPPLFEPGTAWGYSNTGYALLGLTLEKLEGGTPWAQVMERQLFAPLGLRSLGEVAQPVKGLVPGWGKRKGAWRRFEPTQMTMPYAAGGLHGTVDDLARWSAALDAGKVLKPATLAQAFTRQRLASGAEATYGLGWMLTDDGPYRVQSHAGDIDGFQTILYRVPARGLTVVLLSNNDSAERHFLVAPRLAQLALGEDWAPRPVPLTEEALAAYAGAYRTADGRVLRVHREGTQLLLEEPGSPRRALVPLSPTELHAEPDPEAGRPPLRAHFTRLAEGGVQLHVVPWVGGGTLATREAAATE